MAKRSLILSAVLVAFTMGNGSAAVLCAKKAGVVLLRKSACKPRETAVDAAVLGLVVGKGDKGDPGDKGAQGDPGPAGPLATELPSGATLRGVFIVAGTDTPAVAGRAASAISFVFPLAEAPEPHLVSEGAAPSVECPGSVNDPAAAPGHVCVYEGSTGNAFNVDIGDPVSGRGPGSSRFGVWISAVGDFDTNYGVTGTWAVTAP